MAQEIVLLIDDVLKEATEQCAVFTRRILMLAGQLGAANQELGAANQEIAKLQSELAELRKNG